jgi:ectoine hydroxylase-related dioxygenase (phytanoyl-CoA dioxygenase family)
MGGVMRDFEVSISDFEIKDGSISVGNLDRAKKSLLENGFVVLSNLFTKDQILRYRRASLLQLEKWLYDTTHARSRRPRGIAVGNFRIHHPLVLEGDLNFPDLYANFAILAVCKSVLDKNYCLGSMALVSSFPGANRQRTHCDSSFLFPEVLGQSASLPAFSLSVSIPLVNITHEIGGTRFFIGSHRYSENQHFIDMLNGHVESVEPLQKLGSCVIWDGRTQHYGAENNSKSIVRPLIYFNYHRPWFRDLNVLLHPPFVIPKKEYKKIPEIYLPLFETFREMEGKWRFDFIADSHLSNCEAELNRLSLLKEHFERLNKMLKDQEG